MPNIYAYDLECFKNLFTATFVNVENDNDVKTFVIGVGRNDREALVGFLQETMTLVGYNNHSYDDPMLRRVLKPLDAFCKKDVPIEAELFVLSNRLVNDFVWRSDKDILKLRYPRGVYYPWNSIDLMKILAFDKMGISLKQTAINLKWHRIQDMPAGIYENVRPEQVEEILAYNLNDVLITKRLYEEITPLRKLREELSSLYSIDLSSASDSKMANLILENIYSSELKRDIRAVRDMRTDREKVLLADCMSDFISFKTPHLKEVHNRIASTIVYQHKGYRYSEKLHFANCKFALGIGGLHTEDSPGIFLTDDEYIIQDMDVASYYPNLIINNNFYPEHLGVDFIRVLKKITAERLSAVELGQDVKAEALKITINSIFGKLGSPTFWLLDPKQMLSTTVTGQLGLLMLIEELFLNGIQVISANTDGVVCKIPRTLEDKYYEIAHEWEKKTNLTFKFVEYKKYVRRDVNSYITEKPDGSTKEKGAFLKEVDLKKAYRMPIVAKALFAYFINDIPVRETLESCEDIFEFCISQKTGRDFEMELHTAEGVEKLQKTNRFYITKKGGVLTKRHSQTGKVIGLHVGRTACILNDYDPSTAFKDYEVDYSFYEKEVMKIVNEIEPKQLELFDIDSVGMSVLTKMDSSPKMVSTDERLTIKNLNKLGKNQLSSKLKTIAENHELVEDIHTRYVYIKSFEPRSMKAEIYCLAKGVTQFIYIGKTAYMERPFGEGSLIYCSKFSKNKKGEHVIAEYEMSEKIQECNQETLLNF